MPRSGLVAIHAAILAVLSIGGCAAPNAPGTIPATESALAAQGFTPMTADELKAQYATRPRTVEYVQRLKEGDTNGTLRYTTDGGLALRGRYRTSDGRWRIDGNRLCVTYPRPELVGRWGEEYCFRIYRTGDNEVTWYPPEGGARGRFVD